MSGPTKADLQRAVDALTEKGYIGYDVEHGLLYCWYCGAEWRPDQLCHHHDDCAWERAMKLLGKE